MYDWNITYQLYSRILDLKEFHLMVKYLLYFSTYHPVPASSILGMKIKENLGKGGNADNIAFWNWTPEQKNLLVANITRMIMTTHWSTGKTRIIFEKAKILAKNGNSVVIVLYYSKKTEASLYLSDQAPILLYSLLMNEIEQERGDLKDNLKLLMINDLDQVEKIHLKGANVFIDEFVIDSLDALKALNTLYRKVDNLLWVTVAKTSSEFTIFFKDWLENKVKEGCLVPSLIYPLRNSKEIVEFENSLATNLTYHDDAGQEELLTRLLELDEESLIDTSASQMKDSQSTKNQTDDEIQTNSKCIAYGLPTPNWPETGLKYPTNLCHGSLVDEEQHLTGSLSNAVQECWRKLPDKRVLVVVFAQIVPSDLIKAIQETRGHIPLVVDGDSDLKLLRHWLANSEEPQDLVVSSTSIAGFEWHSVLMVTSFDNKSQFYVRNIVMRRSLG